MKQKSCEAKLLQAYQSKSTLSMTSKFLRMAAFALLSSAAIADDFSDAFRKTAGAPWKNILSDKISDHRKALELPCPPEKGAFTVLAPEYYPGWAILSSSPEIYLFQGLPQTWRVGSPTRLAFSVAGTPKVFQEGSEIRKADLEKMDKPWMLVWFAGAKGWEKFDMPVLVVLKHRLKSAKFANGLHLGFEKELGQIVIMNLFGFYRPPQDNPASRQFSDASGKSSDGAFGIKLGELAPTNIRPYEWKDSLPAGIVERCDFLSSTARAIPYFIRDNFQVDLEKNALNISYDVKYLETSDDWGTKALKFAPVPPTISLAARYGFPIKFTGNYFDPVYPTTLGPWCGIKEADSYEVSVGILQYLSEAYEYELDTDSSDPIVKSAVETLTKEAPNFCLDGKPYPQKSYEKGYPKKDIKGTNTNFCWGVITCDRTKAIAMRYVPSDKLDAARENMRNLLEYSYFTKDGYKEEKIGEKTFLYRNDAGLWGKCEEDAGKLAMDMFTTAWLYSYNAKDYGWISPKIEIMEQIASTLAQMGWARGGRASIAEMGDEASPAISFARLMYAARDQKRFAYGAYLSAMELLKVFVKCGPMGDYARKFQPWLRFEKMDDTENATDVWGGAWGWSIGGPGHKPIGKNMIPGADLVPFKRHGSEQWSARWRCMADFDVDRFLAENCVETPGGLKFEFDTWLQRDFSDLGSGYKYEGKNSGPIHFVNPARLMSFRKQYLGESTAQIRKLCNGWDMSYGDVFKSNWNWEPAPWIYWALKDKKEYSRIMKPESLPWAPGLRSEYAAGRNDLVFSSFKLDGKSPSGEQLPPFPGIGWWKTSAGPQGGGWSAGFISTSLENSLECAEFDKNNGIAVFKLTDKALEKEFGEVPLEGVWKFALDPEAKGIKEKWFSKSYDDSKWREIEVPGVWEDQGYQIGGKFENELAKGVLPPEMKANSPPNYGLQYDGSAWYRIKMLIPGNFKNSRLFFHAGAIDDFDMVWFNGVQIGKTDASTTKTWWQDERLYEIPSDSVSFAGENVIAVLVGDNNDAGGIKSGPVRILAKKHDPNYVK